jgi:hypothetical protein
VDSLAANKTLAQLRLNGLINAQEMHAHAPRDEHSAALSTADDKAVRGARAASGLAQHNYLLAKARLDGLPTMNQFEKLLNLYDQQLLRDVQAICPALPGPYHRKMGDLRPHYKAMVEAYVNEFVENKGLTDEAVISFFGHYVHDSLAGFGKDATLPSDPRVVYLGGDEKYRYASIDHPREDEDGARQFA